MEDLGRFRALNRSGVLAGANFIALRRPAYIYMTRRAVVSRVIPTPRCLAVFVANMGFGRGAHITQKCSESVNSFGISVFFFWFLGVQAFEWRGQIEK